MGLFEFHRKFATPSNIRNLFIVTLILSITFPLYFTPLIEQYSGGIPMLDMRWSYTYTDVDSLFTVLGPEGRAAYLSMYTVDLVFPLTLALSLTLVLIFLIGNLFPDKKFMRILVILPFMAASFDYTENAIIISQLMSYPGVSAEIVAISSWLTGLKFLFLLFSVGTLIILGIAHIISTRRA